MILADCPQGHDVRLTTRWMPSGSGPHRIACYACEQAKRKATYEDTGRTVGQEGRAASEAARLAGVRAHNAKRKARLDSLGSPVSCGWSGETGSYPL